MAVLWRGEPWYWDLFAIIIEYHQRMGAGTVGHGTNMGTKRRPPKEPPWKSQVVQILEGMTFPAVRLLLS